MAAKGSRTSLRHEVTRGAGSWSRLDVSSGVESSRGVKDPVLLRAFVDAVRAA
ncbi:hypothetical protein E3T35_18835 [Cryobacterium sp. TMT1-2-2]|nr:hypothetical protein E3T35_18835 [Cryobacterium sp. TMT1-2-2]